MKRYVISWFDEFECLCGDCPETCCKGWLIPLEKEDIARFKKERGRLALSLFCATACYLSDKFNRGSGTCPFLRKDGLCRMQEEKGHDFIPETCRDYPRFYRNYGAFEETFLDLSCVGVVRIFLKHMDDIKICETCGDAESGPCSTNDDAEYLDFLLSERKEMIDAAMKIKDADGFLQYTNAIFARACALQEHFATGTQRCPEGTFGAFLDGVSKEEKGLHNSAKLFPLPQKVMLKLMNCPLRHRRLEMSNPNLYDYLIRADKMFAEMAEKDIDWQETAQNALSQTPKLEKLCVMYLVYYLYLYFLRTYETYTFRRQIALGLCHTNMVLMLIMANTDPDTASDEQIARIVAAYNRMAYFSDSILDRMYRIFEDHYLKAPQLS